MEQSYEWKQGPPKPGDTVIRLIDASSGKIVRGGTYKVSEVRGNDIWLQNMNDVWSLNLFKPLTGQTANYQIF